MPQAAFRRWRRPGSVDSRPDHRLRRQHHLSRPRGLQERDRVAATQARAVIAARVATAARPARPTPP